MIKRRYKSLMLSPNKPKFSPVISSNIKILQKQMKFVKNVLLV